MKRLEEIVSHLEKGDIPLQEWLNLFQEGALLMTHRHTMLEEAEQKVVQLKRGESRQPEEIPFE